ncbi:MAG: hypothetical protein F4X00_01160 [Gemmatimonadetes bacterium]|nr:hypothetical protein [Gemmatimonadota bacterium]
MREVLMAGAEIGSTWRARYPGEQMVAVDTGGVDGTWVCEVELPSGWAKAEGGEWTETEVRVLRAAVGARHRIRATVAGGRAFVQGIDGTEVEIEE